MKQKIIGILFFSILILIDQLSKYIIRYKSGFYICNANLAFGLSASKVFAIITLLTFLFFLYNLKFKIINFKSISNFKFQISNWDTLTTSSFILILSGGVSNIIDRLYLGCVIDFIHFPFWPTFNLADIYITIGIVVLIKKLYFKNKN